jgi:hypothetical protein
MLPEGTVKKSLMAAVAALFTAIPFGAPAWSSEPADEAGAAARPAQPAPTGKSIRADAAQAKQGIKSTAREVRQGVKNTAREIKDGIKRGAANVKRELAVAQCNDGDYSYTRHRTCNHHGGIRQRFR